ncbi:iron complex transport system ATP-binding protein [Hephaestia caeni]|uniref:Iron complex transport system ATP-binding protein n=1 Tax=Hephaestia caeni TaxID=645617 RepID=A0A397PDI9_9SPHN|nr:ABC transporter ATP-binding protein [Hephaestia caeni]RIA43691.1 iron complex transport system ATP-binding protein [Hephaestia caeni]
MDLTIDRLGVTLAGRAVLHDITATFRPGRVTAILGPNGAGKSTLVKAMAALVAIQSGAIRLGERDVAALDPRDRARRIGYLPQDAAIHWNVPARDVIALGRAQHHAPFAGLSEGDHAAIADAVAATATADLLNRPVNELSGGERARVLLARVLAGAPQWLLADEPLASLDPAHQIDILDRLRARAAAGAGVAIVLHDLVQAGRAADDVLLLKAGRVAAFGPAAQVLTPANLRAVFAIDVSVTADSAGRPLCIPIGRATG